MTRGLSRNGVRTISGILATVLTAAASPAWTCDFCPTGSVSLLMAQRQADATVTVEVIGKRLKFRSDAPAILECRLKVVGVLAGQKANVGDTFTALVEPTQIQQATKAVAMLNVVNRGVSLQDIFPDPDGQLAEYLTAAGKLGDLESPEAVAFFAARLEDRNRYIAEDVHGQFAAIPFEKVRAAADRLPAEQLRKWLLDEQVNPTRKSAYGLMLGLCGKADDASVLSKALTGVGDNAQAAGGILAGWVLLTGQPKEVLGPMIRDATRPLKIRRAALNVLRFLMVRLGDRYRDECREMFRLALADKRTAEYALDEMARAGDFSQLDEVKRLWLDPQRSTHNVQVYTRFYAALMPLELRTEFLDWLKKNPSPTPAPEE